MVSRWGQSNRRARSRPSSLLAVNHSQEKDAFHDGWTEHWCSCQLLSELRGVQSSLQYLKFRGLKMLEVLGGTDIDMREEEAKHRR